MTHSAVALLAEGVDRNIGLLTLFQTWTQSPSSRRAWIEITTPQTDCPPQPVALLAEGVDRNIAPARYALWSVVALLAEGVDRNRF